MTNSIQDLQNHFHFQLSLLRLMKTGTALDAPSTLSTEETVEIVEQEQLQDALTRIASAIY